MGENPTVEGLLDRARTDLMSCREKSDPAQQRLTAQMAGLRAAAAVALAGRHSPGRDPARRPNISAWEALRRVDPALFAAAASLRASAPSPEVTPPEAAQMMQAAQSFVEQVERSLGVRR